MIQCVRCASATSFSYDHDVTHFLFSPLFCACKAGPVGSEGDARLKHSRQLWQGVPRDAWPCLTDRRVTHGLPLVQTRFAPGDQANNKT